MAMVAAVRVGGPAARRTASAYARQRRGESTEAVPSAEPKSPPRQCLSTRLPSGEELRIHHVPGYISSLFVCEYPERQQTLLLDAGTAGDYDTINAYLKQHIVADWAEPHQRLSLALSSHAHTDHIGSIHRFLAAGTTCMVADRYEEFYAGFGGSIQHWIDNGLAAYVAYRLGKPVLSAKTVWYPKAMPREVRSMLSSTRLTDGLVLPGFEDWATLYIPGHTGHMVAFYHAASHTFYCADLMIHRKKQFWAPVGVELEGAYRHTLRRLRGLRVRTLLLPHGGVVDVDAAGGWAQVVDNVERHTKASKDTAFVRLLNGSLLGWGREHLDYEEARLPTNPLPLAAEVPAPMVTLAL